ncbi:MAG: DUF120 domain-containing protein [Thermoplasmatota archaeon]
MLPEDKEILKALARQGGLHEFVPTSSGELAERLGMSQQTASRKILELVDQGLIARRMGTRKQLIRLSPAGTGVLRKEYGEYLMIFQGGERLTFHGRIVAGLGEGRYYISREGYRSQFRKLLDFDPFPGTLNVEIELSDREKIAELRQLEGLPVHEFQDEGRTFGAVKCFRAEVTAKGPKGTRTAAGAAILPVRSHYATVLEVIAPRSLREDLGLSDSAEVTVTVRVEAGFASAATAAGA